MKAALYLAAAVATGFGTVNDDHWPPDHWRGVGKSQVVFVRYQAEIDRLCGKAPNGFVTQACSTEGGLIVLPDPCGFSGEYARIVCHENAHRFGGWDRTHPL